MPPFDQLVQSIDARIQELNSDMASLQAARSALVADAAAPTPRSAAKASRTTRRRRRMTHEPLTAAAAEQLLATSDGLTTAALAQRAGAGRDQVLGLLRELETARRVRRTGQRRGTRWHAITDEDRIRERAAELDSLSRRRARA
jgi:DNA-binding CsgD family transcriptional regulator